MQVYTPVMTSPPKVALPCSEDTFPPTRLLMLPPAMLLMLPPPLLLLPFDSTVESFAVIGAIPLTVALLAPPIISQFQPVAVTTVWL